MGKEASHAEESDHEDQADDKGTFLEKAAKANYDSDESLARFLPTSILTSYQCKEWRNAGAILRGAYPNELADILAILANSPLKKSYIVAPGGGKSPYTKGLEKSFNDRGWKKRIFETAIVVDGAKRDSPTHEVDCFKNGVALEIEWSNKDPFFDRDLTAFRLLFDLRVVGVGVIITKADELGPLFNDLGKWEKYGTSTTWMHKLLPRVEGGGGGGCPLLVFGIRSAMYDKNG